MDSSLLRERESFKKKALSNPIVEKRPSTTPLDDQRNHKKRKMNDPKLNTKNKTSSTNHQNFGVLANVVMHLRTKYLQGNQKPLTLEEILQETKQTNINPDVILWLSSDALKVNPKITVIKDKFMFKATYKLEDKKSLLKLLEHNDAMGLGGILREEVVDSLPKAEEILKILENQNKIKTTIRSSDKKKVLFYSDQKAILDIDDEFKKLYKTVAVNALTDNKISGYLKNQGFSAMKGESFKKPVVLKNKRKKQIKTKDNVHMADILETYDNLIGS